MAPFEYLDQEIDGFWHEFTMGKAQKNNILRPEIFESWVRSRAWGVDPHLQKNLVSLDAAELEELCRRKSDLLEVAIPVMNDIYEFTEETGFGVWLSDENGIILEALTNEPGVEDAISNGFIPGADWSEKTVGTNAIGTCLFLKKPIHISWAEHYCKVGHPYSCSAAPIFDSQGDIKGVLCITGFLKETNHNPLGIVLIGISAIERELHLQTIYKKVELAHQYVLEMMESLPSGVVVVDADARITNMNRKACEMLKTPEERALNQKIFEKFGRFSCVENALKYGKAQEEEEQYLEMEKQRLHIMVACRPIMNSSGSLDGAVIVLREIEAARRMTAKMAGYTARFTFNDIIGQGPSFIKELERARSAAATQSNILIIGESGSGKEMVAQAIHNESPRRHGPFVAINCGALPKELIGSELFGYEEGAFTGAKRGGNPGKFELANNGTLFLDEIGDMPLDLQLMLLRVLQEKVVVRLGGQQQMRVNVRLIAATNKSLQQMLSRELFRQDLYYRINVITLRLPPLRERTTDTSLLADYFIGLHASRTGKDPVTLHPMAVKALEQYDWPGNVRELENTIERGLVFCKSSILQLEDLNISETLNIPTEAVENNISTSPKKASQLTLRAEEKSIILSTLENCEWNKTQAAKRLGITRATLYRKMNCFGIENA